LDFESILHLFTELSNYLNANKNHELVMKPAQTLRNTVIQAAVKLNAEVLERLMGKIHSSPMSHTKRSQQRRMNFIRSYLDDIYTEEVNNIALPADDDKRVILEDVIHTLAYGYHKIPKSVASSVSDLENSEVSRKGIG